jgi:dipeptidyl aminopeptidase/acylaminoacyl peptidase
VIKHGAIVRSASFSPDGNKVITTSWYSTAKVVDLKTGKEQVIQNGDSVRSASFSPDGNKVITTSMDHTAKVVELKTGKEQVIQHGDFVTSASFSPYGSKAITFSGKTAKVVDLHTGKELEINHFENVSSASFSPDGNKVITASWDSTAKVVDLKRGKEQVIKHGNSVYSASFSPDGNKVITASRDRTAKVVDLKTGKEQVIQHGDRVDSASFSPDGIKVITVSGDGTVTVVDLHTGNVQVIKYSDRVRSASFSPDGSKVITVSWNGTVIVVDFEKICIDTGVRINDFCLTCKEKDNIPELDLILESQLCKLDFNNDLWKKETPTLAKNQKNFSGELARKYLLRFQKPGGFVPQTDLPLVLALLKSDFKDTEPELISGMLQNILFTSNQLYQRLLEDFPYLLSLKTKKENMCRSESEKKQIEEVASKYYQYLKVANGKSSKIKAWESLSLLAPFYSATQKEEMLHEITESVANGAADTGWLSNVFLSKIYYFVKQGVSKILGEKSRTMSDITLVREAQQVRPLILSTDSIDGDAKTKTEFGFFVKEIAPIKISENMNIQQDKSWVVAGKKYTTDIKIKALNKDVKLVLEEKSPRYQELWQDKKLHGIVVTGTNLKGDAAQTMDQYLAYYQNEGFVFSAQKEEVKDLETFLRERIKNGEADYFIKEAHSDGDEKNLFRLDKVASKLTGIKKMPDGKEEVIELVFPSSNSTETKLISNQDFGQWLRSRDQKKKSQFVYFNTSCWSKTKAIHEIEAAQTTTLLNIPTLTIAHTFGNNESNAEFQLLEAFRDSKDYEGIRTAMEKNEGYKKRQGDVFLFPDEYDYKRHITEVLATPLEMSVQVKDESGKILNIDEMR